MSIHSCLRNVCVGVKKVPSGKWRARRWVPAVYWAPCDEGRSDSEEGELLSPWKRLCITNRMGESKWPLQPLLRKSRSAPLRRTFYDAKRWAKGRPLAGHGRSASHTRLHVAGRQEVMLSSCLSLCVSQKRRLCTQNAPRVGFRHLPSLRVLSPLCGACRTAGQPTGRYTGQSRGKC